jgi:hypothetical protein
VTLDQAVIRGDTQRKEQAMSAARPTRYMPAVVLFILIGALVLMGCGSGSSSTATGQSTAAVDSEPFAASALVGAREHLEGTTTEVGDITQVRNGTATYDVEATDARLAGIFDVVFNYDLAQDGSATMWGTWKLTNDKGTWVCDSWRGAFDPAGNTFTVGQGRGTGAYEGLASYWQWYMPRGELASLKTLPFMWVSGWVEKAQ